MMQGASARTVAAGKASFEIAGSAPGRLVARGALTFETARRARALGRIALRDAGPKLAMDCAAISQSDSAGLAVLLDWLAEARRSGRSLRYEQLPAGLLGLARISAVDEFLLKGV